MIRFSQFLKRGGCSPVRGKWRPGKDVVGLTNEEMAGVKLFPNNGEDAGVKAIDLELSKEASAWQDLWQFL